MPFTAGGLVKASLIGGVSAAATFGISKATLTITQLIPKVTVRALLQGGLQGTTTGITGGNFWKGFASGALASLATSFVEEGVGKIKEQVAFKRGANKLGIEGSDPVPQTDAFIKQAQEAWYPDAPMNQTKVFTVENLSKIAKEYFKNSPGTGGITLATLTKEKIYTGFSKVYFNPNVAFTSAKELFYTMGHELVHVSQISELVGQTKAFVSGLRGMMEFHAYGYEASLGRHTLNSFTPGEIRTWMNDHSDWFKRLSHNNFDWTKNTNFKYPF